jgi:hypothetical protein
LPVGRDLTGQVLPPGGPELEGEGEGDELGLCDGDELGDDDGDGEALVGDTDGDGEPLGPAGPLSARSSA